MTRTEFLAGMTYLSAAISKPTPPEQMEVYFDLLGKLSFDVFQEAIRRSLLGLENNFLPPAGVIYHHACDILIRRRHLDETEQRKRLDRRETAYPSLRRLLHGIGKPQDGSKGT